MTVLDIQNLQLQMALTHGKTPILRGVNLSIESGETCGLVGESGAGKTMVAKALLGILPKRVRDVRGKLLFRGQDLLALSPRHHRRLLGRDISLIPQDPMVALNPVQTIRWQFHAALKRHTDGSRVQLDQLAVDGLLQVSLPEPKQLLQRYPHELSGGMRQRVLIAMAFASKPALVVADEPTTALDVTVQKQVLSLLKRLQSESGTAVLFVTHDLGVVAKLCDTVYVMHSGRVVEHGRCEQIIGNPQHRYTQALLNATPHFERPAASLTPVDESVTDQLQCELESHNPLSDSVVTHVETTQPSPRSNSSGTSNGSIGESKVGSEHGANHGSKRGLNHGSKGEL